MKLQRGGNCIIGGGKKGCKLQLVYVRIITMYKLMRIKLETGDEN